MYIPFLSNLFKSKIEPKFSFQKTLDNINKRAIPYKKLIRSETNKNSPIFQEISESIEDTLNSLSEKITSSYDGLNIKTHYSVLYCNSLSRLGLHPVSLYSAPSFSSVVATLELIHDSDTLPQSIQSILEPLASLKIERNPNTFAAEVLALKTSILPHLPLLKESLEVLTAQVRIENKEFDMQDIPALYHRYRSLITNLNSIVYFCENDSFRFDSDTLFKDIIIFSAAINFLKKSLDNYRYYIPKEYQI